MKWISKIIEKWIQEKIIPNFPPRSVLVSDYAPYHNAELKNLQRRHDPVVEKTKYYNITFNSNAFKIELYGLIKLHKPLYKTFVILTPKAMVC